MIFNFSILTLAFIFDKIFHLNVPLFLSLFYFHTFSRIFAQRVQESFIPGSIVVLLTTFSCSIDQKTSDLRHPKRRETTRNDSIEPICPFS